MITYGKAADTFAYCHDRAGGIADRNKRFGYTVRFVDAVDNGLVAEVERYRAHLDQQFSSFGDRCLRFSQH